MALTAQQRRNIKTWEKNTKRKFSELAADDYDLRYRIKKGLMLGTRDRSPLTAKEKKIAKRYKKFWPDADDKNIKYAIRNKNLEEEVKLLEKGETGKGHGLGGTPFDEVTVDGKVYKKNPETGKLSVSIDEKIVYFTPQQLKKRNRDQRIAKIKATKEKELKTKKLKKEIQKESLRDPQTVKKTNEWTKNWVNKNAKNYGVRDFDIFKKDLADAWTKQSEIFEKDPKFRARSTADGLPSVKGLKIDKVSTPLQKDPTLGYEKIFYNKMLQRPDFKKKITEYLKFVNLDKRFGDVRDKMVAEGKLATGAGGKGFAPGGSKLAYLKYAKFLDDDVVYFMGDVLNSRKLWNNNPQSVNIYSILEENINPKLVKAYRKKLGGAYTSWMNNLRAVSKLAGYDFDKVLAAQYAEAAKMKKVFNVENLPFEFQYAQDHLFGLAEAKELGDKKIAQQTLNNLVASTKEQNRYLGTKGFSQRRTKLMRDFVKAPVDARQPIIDKLNIISEEYLPGRLEYGLNPDGSLKMENLQPEKTFKSRAIGYGTLVKDFPKPVQSLALSLINQGKTGGPVCNLAIVKAVRGGRATGGSGIDCSGQIKQVLQENPDQLIQDAANAKVKPGESTGFRNIARQILSKIPKGGKLGALVAGAGAVGLGAGALMADELDPETDTMVYSPVEGKFVDKEDGDPEDQMGILNWIADNPVKSSLMSMPAMYGIGAGANKLGAAKTAAYLTGWKAVIPAMMVPEKLWQYREGESLAEMTTDPWNAIWALGIDSSKSLAKKGEYYINLIKDPALKARLAKEFADAGGDLAKKAAIGKQAFEVTGANILGKGFWGSKDKMARLGASITSPAAAGTDLAFQSRFKPAMGKMADVFGSQVTNKLAKRGIGSLAKRALMMTAAGAGLAATGVAGTVLAPLMLTLFGVDYLREQFGDYSMGKKKIDRLRSMGKISEEDANNYMSLLMQENLLPFGVGNRLFGKDEMMIGGQLLDPDDQRSLAAGMEDEIDSIKEADKGTRAKWRQQEFFDEGGRVGMKFGGSMDRRGFLKWLAGITAGAMGGVKGLWKPGAKKVVEKVAKETLTTTNPEMWVPRLIAKIKAEGKLLELADKKYVNGDIYEALINGKKVRLESNPVSGQHQIDWQAPDYDGEMTRSINFSEGELITEGEMIGKKTKSVVEFLEPDRSTPYRDDFSDFDWVNDSDQVLDDMQRWIGIEDVTVEPTGPKTTSNWEHEYNQGGEVETGAIARRQSEVPPLSGPDPQAQGIAGLFSQPKQVRVG